MRKNQLRELLNAGKPTIGTHVITTSPEIVEVIGHSGLSRQQHLELGKTIRKTVMESDKKFVFIASGDLIHGMDDRERVYDKKMVEKIKTGHYKDILQMDPVFVQKAQQCAYKPLVVGLGVLDGKPLQNRVFSYEAPFGVGYMVGSL